MDRADVYKLIDGEREYQIERHLNHKIPHRDEDHSIADWIVYIEEHIAKAKTHIYWLNFDSAMAEMRKIVALGVACMHYIDAPPR